MRDLLECAWPAALDTARQPFRSGTWMATLSVIAGRDGGDFTRTRRLGAARFEQPVRREITRHGGHKPCLRIVRGLFAALTDPAGVIAHRPGVLERVQLLLEDWQLTRTRLNDTEQRMTGVLGELGLTALVTSMTGLSPVGGAAILAETGDPRPGPPRPLPVPDQQGAEQAHAHPGADHHRRRDLAATARRHHHRAGLGPGHSDPRNPTAKQATRRLAPSAAFKLAAGEPSAALRHPVISAHIMGSPVRRLLNPITRCRDQPHNRYAGTGDGRGTGQSLTQTNSR
jgi:hypothetical protein